MNPLKSEANIQAEFYHQCRLINLPCALEINTPAGRLDCGIFSPDFRNLLLIIEVKIPEKRPTTPTRQLGRYSRLGVPIICLASLSECSPLASRLKKYFHDYYPGVPFSEVLAMKKIDRHRFRAKPFSVLELDPDINLKL